MKSTEWAGWDLQTISYLALAKSGIHYNSPLPHAESFSSSDMWMALCHVLALTGTGKLGNLVHVIDFSLAVEYRDLETRVHMAYATCTS